LLFASGGGSLSPPMGARWRRAASGCLWTLLALAHGPLGALRGCESAPVDHDRVGGPDLDAILEGVVGLRQALADAKSWDYVYFSDPPKHPDDRHSDPPPLPRDLAEAAGAQFISGAALPVQVFVVLVGFTDGRGEHGLRLAKADLKHKLGNQEASAPPLVSLRQMQEDGRGGGRAGADAGAGGEVHRVAFAYQWNAVAVDAAVTSALERELRLGMRALDPAGEEPASVPRSEGDVRTQRILYQVDVDRLERVLDDLVDSLGLRHGCTVVVMNPKRFRGGYGFRPGLSRPEMQLLRSTWNGPAEPELPEARAFMEAFRTWMGGQQRGGAAGGGGDGGETPAGEGREGSSHYWSRYAWKTGHMNFRDLEESSREWAEKWLEDTRAEWEVWEGEEGAVSASGPGLSDTVRKVREARFWRHALELLTDAGKGRYLEAILKAKGEENLPAEACLVTTWVSQQRWMLMDLTAGPLKWGPKHRPLDCVNTALDVPSPSSMWVVQHDLLQQASEAMEKLETDIEKAATARTEDRKAEEAKKAEEEAAARELKAQANETGAGGSTDSGNRGYDYYDYGGSSWNEKTAELKDALLVRLHKYRELATSVCRTPEEQRSAVCVALADRIHHTEREEGEEYALKDLVAEARNVTDEATGNSVVSESLLEAIFGKGAEAATMVPNGVDEFITGLRSAIARAVHSAIAPPLVRSTGIGASSRHDRDVVFRVQIVHEGSQTMRRWDHGRGRESGFPVESFKEQMLKLEPPSAKFSFDVSHVDMRSNKRLEKAFKASLRENHVHSHGSHGHVHSLVDALALSREISGDSRGWTPDKSLREHLAGWIPSHNGKVKSPPLVVPVYVFDLDAPDGPILFSGDVQAVALPGMVLALQSNPVEGREAEFAHALQDWPAMDVHCGDRPLGFDATSALAPTLAACAEWVAGLSRAPLRSVMGLSNAEGSFADEFTGEAWREDWLWAVGEGPLSATGGASAGFLLRSGLTAPATFPTLAVDQAHRGRVAIESDRLLQKYNRATAVLHGTSTAGLRGARGGRHSFLGWFDTDLRDIYTHGDRDQVYATTDRRSYKDQLQKDQKSIESAWRAMAIASGRLEWDVAFDELDKLETVVNRFAATAREAAVVCLRRRHAPLMPDHYLAHREGPFSDPAANSHALVLLAVTGLALLALRSQPQPQRRQRLGFLLAAAKDKAS